MGVTRAFCRIRSQSEADQQASNAAPFTLETRIVRLSLVEVLEERLLRAQGSTQCKSARQHDAAWILSLTH
jgi:hypothetical protein